MEPNQCSRQLARAQRYSLFIEAPHKWAGPRAKHMEARRRFENNEMSKDELLHYLRTWREAFHRIRIQNGFDHFVLCWNSTPGRPRAQRPNAITSQRIQRTGNKESEQSWGHDFWELANKSVPFYILTNPEYNDNRMPPLLRKSLGCYLYAKWFRPYKSNVEFNQFIAKLVVPMDLPSDNTGMPSARIIDDLCETTKSLTTYMKLAKHHLTERIGKSAATKPLLDPDDRLWEEQLDRFEPNSIAYWWQTRREVITPQRLVANYTRLPLFQAIGIVLCVESWNENDDSCTMGKTPVCMFLTGEGESELSAPINFDAIQDDKIQAVLQRGPRKAIQTTLDTAVEFIIALEDREADFAAKLSGTSSSHVEATYYPKPKFSESYNHFFEGRDADLLARPSSEWVNTQVYTEWTGFASELDHIEYFKEKKYDPTFSGSWW